MRIDGSRINHCHPVGEMILVCRDWLVIRRLKARRRSIVTTASDVAGCGVDWIRSGYKVSTVWIVPSLLTRNPNSHCLVDFPQSRSEIVILNVERPD